MRYLIPFLLNNGGWCQPISPEMPTGINKIQGNMSLVYTGEKIIYNIRCTDYMYILLNGDRDMIYLNLMGGGRCESTNMIGYYNPEKPKHPLRRYHDVVVSDHPYWGTYSGIEDMRLAYWGDTLYGIGFSTGVVEGQVLPTFIRFTKDLDIDKMVYLDTVSAVEKNWQPVADMPFTFVYDPGLTHGQAKTITLDPDIFDKDTTMVSVPVDVFEGGISGSSQLIPIPDGYLSICHKRTVTGYPDKGHTVYSHYFVLYDKQLNVKQISPDFQFMEPTIEFCCGICMDEMHIYISFNICDTSNHILCITRDRFMDLLPVLFGGWEAEHDPTYYEHTLDMTHPGNFDRLLYNSLLQYDHVDERYSILADILPKVSDIGIRNGILLHTYLRQRNPDRKLLKMIKKINNK